MSTMSGMRRRSLSDLIRALIEEAWRRARRRRLIYAGIVLALAVIGAVVTATLRGGPPGSSSSPTAVASASTPFTGVAVSVQRAPHHYHLYPGDVVDVDGGPSFAWSCSYYWVGGQLQKSYRLFRCARTDSGQPGAGDRLRLNVVVSRDNVFVERGHKTLYVAWR